MTRQEAQVLKIIVRDSHNQMNMCDSLAKTIKESGVITETQIEFLLTLNHQMNNNIAFMASLMLREFANTISQINSDEKVM